MNELFEEWYFSARIDPLEHVLSLAAGFVSGVLLGAAFTWMVIGG